MLVDFLTFFFIYCALRDFQIIEFAAVVLVKKVVFAVLKQGFLSRIIINFRICYMISFRPRQPFHTAEISGERYAGYSLQFGIIAFGHFFIADIALRDKIIVFFQLLHFADKFSLEVFRGINICQPFFK